MFVRKKKNKTGVISIQVIDKSTGSYVLLKTIGSSKYPDEINRFYNQGKDYIKTFQGQQTLNFTDSDFNETVVNNQSSI